ncbi:OsmC family protein [Sulfolobus tengchongensis]|uniref:OsmC family protein n=1 Tax=Sulfolobus tengchongensis TaxID=207809 RepID=A0AAX4L3L8_9CREN
MEISFTLSGDLENPMIELGGKISRAKNLYQESPLMAFLVSIPHCIANMTDNIAKKEGIPLASCKIIARYVLDEKAIMFGNYIFKKIIIEVHSKGCSEDELKELIEKVKRECPIYLSFRDKIEIEGKTLY